MAATEETSDFRRRRRRIHRNNVEMKINRLSKIQQCQTSEARKSKREAMSKCEARANANSGISVASSVLKGRASGVGPYSQFCRFRRSALLRISARRLMGRRSLPPHTRVVRVRSVPTAGSRAGSQFPSPGHGPGLSVLNKGTYKLKITGHRHTGRA